ncbi:hypothetical protein ES703_49287 [subsurface metagenome]
MAFPIASAIGAAASIGGALIGKSSADEDRAMTAAQNAQMVRLNKAQFKDLQQKSIRHKVADAKAAGLHPLFALGGTASGASPTPFIPGQSRTGNQLGEGLAAAGRQIARGGLVQAQIESYKASANRDNAQAAQTLSETKRAEQNALNIRGSWTGAPPAKTYPLPGQLQTEWKQLPATQYGRETRPGYVDVQLPDGTWTKVLNQDLGLDEIAQIEYVARRIGERTSQWAHKKRRIPAWLKKETVRARKRSTFWSNR